MAVMPLVLETKMVDVGKQISLGNLLVRKVTWLRLTATSATLILSRDFGVDCMTRIVYIYSCLSRTYYFLFRLTKTTCYLTLRLTVNTLSYTTTYRLAESTLSTKHGHYTKAWTRHKKFLVSFAKQKFGISNLLVCCPLCCVCITQLLFTKVCWIDIFIGHATI